MNQNIKDRLFIHSFKPSIEELELFHSYKTQLDSSFNTYKQNNLAISNQENELKSIKIKPELMFESYEIQKEELGKTLENLKKEIENQKKVLAEVNYRSKEARRRLRYYIRKADKICQENCWNEESLKSLETF